MAIKNIINFDEITVSELKEHLKKEIIKKGLKATPDGEKRVREISNDDIDKHILYLIEMMAIEED